MCGIEQYCSAPLATVGAGAGTAAGVATMGATGTATKLGATPAEAATLLLSHRMFHSVEWQTA